MRRCVAGRCRQFAATASMIGSKPVMCRLATITGSSKNSLAESRTIPITVTEPSMNTNSGRLMT